MSRRVEFAAIRAFSALAGALPWGVGQYPIARPYIDAGRWPGGALAEQRMSNGSRLSIDLGDTTQLSAYLLRDFAPELTRYIAPLLPRGGTLFDVGANIGLVTFAIAAQRPDVTISAFEPSAPNIAAWKRNRALNPRADVRLVEAAVSDHENGARLSVPADSGSGRLADEGVEVATVTLDAHCARQGIERIDVIKIDVEGHEPAVLAGADRLLRDRAIGMIVCEVKHSGRGDGDPAAILARYGYRRVTIPAVGVFSRLRGRGHDQDAAFQA
jgi:FkbM family methyltransferase